MTTYPFANFRDLLNPYVHFTADDGYPALRIAEPDEILARRVVEIACPTCQGRKRVGCPGPGHDRAHTQKERDALGLRKGIDYCYGMHMGHPCPACDGTGLPSVAQLLSWGQAVAEADPYLERWGGDDLSSNIIDFHAQLLANEVSDG